MKKGQILWKWVEGQVDQLSEHIELYHGDIESEELWRPVALVGPPKDYTFSVTWIADIGNPEEIPMIEAARKELDFYLLEVGGPDPWVYAGYHCNTAANLYSKIHWVYSLGDKPKGQRYASYRRRKRRR